MISETTRKAMQDLSILRESKDKDKFISYLDHAIKTHRDAYELSESASDFQRGKLAGYIELKNKIKGM